MINNIFSLRPAYLPCQGNSRHLGHLLIRHYDVETSIWTARNHIQCLPSIEARLYVGEIMHT
jgi:hypothetical protein